MLFRMPIDIAIPTSTAVFEKRGDVLRVTGVTGGPLELRVDEGLVFARYIAQEPRVWSAVTLSSVMSCFTADSPVGTFLRTHGAFPLRQLLLQSLTRGFDATDDPA